MMERKSSACAFGPRFDPSCTKTKVLTENEGWCGGHKDRYFECPFKHFAARLVPGGGRKHWLVSIVCDPQDSTRTIEPFPTLGVSGFFTFVRL